LPWSESLGLPQPTGIGGHAVIAPGVAACLQLAQQLRGGIAAGIPALEQGGFLGGEHTRAEITAAEVSHKGRTSKVLLHRAPIQPEVLRNGPRCPAFMVQGPDLLMQRLPAGLALRRMLLRRERNIVWWHGHSQRPVGQRHGLLA